MPNTQSPYIAFAMLLSSNGHPVTPAELHGLLIGRSCAGAGFDADGREALQHLKTCGLSITAVRSARVYELTGNFSKEDVRHLAEELLSDPVVEKYSLDESIFTLEPGRGHWLEGWPRDYRHCYRTRYDDQGTRAPHHGTAGL